MKSKFLFITVVLLMFFASCKRDEAKRPMTPEELAEELAGNLDEVVNTSADEFAPIISADGKIMYFVSDRKGGMGGQDIWKTVRVGGHWTPPINLGAPLNTPADEGLDTFSQDEKTVYLTSDSRPDGLGKNDIYLSRFINNKWTEPENLGAPINSEYNDANASLSADGKKLFFVSDRPGGQGGYDIWVSELGADGKWGEPKNLGEPINTPDWEGAVFIAPDGLTLYFSSNGHEGYGGADIFRSDYQNGKWSQPQNLGDKINTEGNDTYFTIPGAGDVAYFSSTREGGKGKNDIIALPMPYVFEPKKIVVVVGKVVKQDTKEPLKAWIKIKYRPTRRDLAVIDTRENGSFRISFFPQRELVLMIYADPSEGESFNPWYEPLELDIAKDNQVLVRNIAMAPGKKAVLIEKTEEGNEPQ